MLLKRSINIKNQIMKMGKNQRILIKCCKKEEKKESKKEKMIE
jgi:hypothetical protein